MRKSTTTTRETTSEMSTPTVHRKLESSRRAVAGLVAVMALLATLGTAASPAFAKRAFDSQITGLQQTNNIAFDASGDVWIADDAFPLHEYGPFPSLTLLEDMDTQNAFGFSVRETNVAVDQSTGEVFESQANGRSVAIFKNGKFVEKWTGINGVTGCCVGDVHIAIDNSETNSRGRVYLSLAAPENDVEVLDVARRPVQLPGTASYIEGNKLIGTPAGDFGKVESVAVDDSNGDLYVVDSVDKVVDEFDSTGTFLRSYPDPRAQEGFNPGEGGIGVDPTTGNLIVLGGSAEPMSEYDSNGNLLDSYTEDAPGNDMYTLGNPGVNDAGFAYVPSESNVDIFRPNPPLARIDYAPVGDPTPTSGVLGATIDPGGAGDVTECKFEYGTDESYGLGSIPCTPDAGSSAFSEATEASAEISGLTTDTTYHYRVVAESANGVKYGADEVYTPGVVLGLDTGAATAITESAATLNASFVGNGEGTNYHFEWGKTAAYGSSTPQESAGSPSGPDRTSVSTTIEGLDSYTTYHYRVVATNGAGTSVGPDRMFTTLPGLPVGRGLAATEVHADRAELHGEINPSGGHTKAHFEYVSNAQFEASEWEDAVSVPSAGVEVGFGREFVGFSTFVSGLEAGTLYHYRIVGTNGTGSGYSAGTFRTFSIVTGVNDACPNAHVRQQTGAALLNDCRAYELVSAANSGGYDVESDLAPGQTPFGGYPEAQGPSRVLYGVHDGGIPGTGDSTNHGVDPYVATRGEDGWTTRYVGIPADQPGSDGPFGSSLDEAESQLDTFAFGGPEICKPCFPDGSRGIPVHMPNGSLVQGMAGSLNPGPGAEPAGYVGRRFSADGSHLVFGSTSKFEPDGNENGDVSIYDRNLDTGVTHVVSKTPGGATMTGSGIGELDISRNGSRIVFGQLISTDAEGNRYWHLYMNIGDSSKSIDLTPGTTTGALYDGMTPDGSAVYLTTADPLTSDDEDESADIYRADVSTMGATLTRVSTGPGVGNSDSCETAANTVRPHWNDVNGEENCNAVAVGGGGGVTATGGVYFLSPELLDGPSNGVEGAPNLYFARPGSSPRFVGTLESNANAPLPKAVHPYLRSFGSFLDGLGVAIDHSNGDIYVLDVGNFTTNGSGYIYKFDSSGHTATGFGEGGKLTIPGTFPEYGLPCGIAVDNDPSSPNHGDLYVPDLLGSAIHIFAPNGVHVGDINGVPFPTAVAVSPADGKAYVASYFGGVFVFDTAGSLVTSFSSIANPTGIAVSGAGTVYVSNGGGLSQATGETEAYSTSGTDLGPIDEGPSYAVSVDPSDEHVYVDEGNRVVEFNPSGEEVGSPTGTGRLGESAGVAADDGQVDATNRAAANLASFGPAATPPDQRTDSPVVVDSVGAAGSRRPGDFQVAPVGDDAVFVSSMPLTGYGSAAHREVFRYAPSSGELNCASCNSTGEQATGESALAANGLSIDEAGRVYFSSSEGLVDRDLNGKEDAYEWEPSGFDFGNGSSACKDEGGCIQLLSTGSSSYAASLLSASDDGTDAYFFTRQKLAEEDENGNTVKIYDARELGGFPYSPPPVQCKASDECHGPASPIPPPPNIKSQGKSPNGDLQEGGCEAAKLKLRAKRLAHRARRLASHARKARSHKAALRMHRQAQHAARRSKRERKAAAKCTKSGNAGSGSRGAK